VLHTPAGIASEGVHDALIHSVLNIEIKIVGD
jgi:putative NIF3 family GTP cyclohydrolase 1 type 2